MKQILTNPKYDSLFRMTYKLKIKSNAFFHYTYSKIVLFCCPCNVPCDLDPRLSLYTFLNVALWDDFQLCVVCSIIFF